MFVKYYNFTTCVCFCIVFLVIGCRPAVSFTTIKSLPGFSALLPFKLETGYIAVGDVELFYYFIESERNPAKDPLLLWLTGGPGCSALAGLFFEIGPLKFNMVEYNGSLPTFALNPYSWTKVASIIFIDAPVGTGFSYSRTSQGMKTGDKEHANYSYNFLRKWFTSAASGIEDKQEPVMYLKGYWLGNPITDPKFDGNSKISFYHSMALISDELYESVKSSCNKEYVEVDVSNVKCAKDLQAISEAVAHIAKDHILEAFCPMYLLVSNSLDSNRKYFFETYEDSLHYLPADNHHLDCRNYKHYLCKVWANDISVQKALHIRKGKVKEWVRCNKHLDYDRDVQTALSYHLYLNTRGYRALVYSGDHDSVAPHIGTQSWIKSLNFSIVDDWRPWMVDGQVAGYTREFQNNFTYATVKGAGHTAPEYKRKECFAMFKRWLSHRPL